MTNSIAKDFRFFSLLRFAFPTMIMMVFMSLYTTFILSRKIDTIITTSKNKIKKPQQDRFAFLLRFLFSLSP